MSKQRARPSVQENAMLELEMRATGTTRSQSSNHSGMDRHMSAHAVAQRRPWLARWRADGFVFRQESLYKIMWDSLVLLVVTVIAVTLPMEMAIHEWADPGIFGSNFDLFIKCVFYTDILVNFNSAVLSVDTFGHEFENTNRCFIATRYLRFWFWIDAISTFPVASIISPDTDASPVKLIRMMRLGRLAKLAKVMSITQLDAYLDYLQDLTCFEMTNAQSYFIRSLCLILGSLLFQVHYSACLLLAFPDTWSSNLDKASSLPPNERFNVAWEWTLNLVISGSKGDGMVILNPGTATSLIPIFLLLLHCFNILMVAKRAGFLQGQASQDLDADATRSTLARFLRRKRVAPRLRRKVDVYLRKSSTQLWGKKVDELLGKLSDSVRKEVQCGLFSGFVNEFPPFTHEPLNNEAFLLDLAPRIKMQFRAPDEEVVSSGIPAEGLFRLHSGAVHVTEGPHDSPTDFQIQTGSYFGAEAIFLSPGSRGSPITVKTSEFSEFLILTCEEFDRACHPEEAFEFVQFVRSFESDVSADEFSSYALFEETLYLRWQSFKQQDCIHLSSEDLGVPLLYLTEEDCFLKDVETMLGQELAEHETFRKLQATCWGDENCEGFCGSQEENCPRDGKMGCAIIDTLDDRFPQRGFRGRFTHYLSWCWDYSCHHMVSGLNSWMLHAKAVADDTFIWICFFCNNQRKILFDCQVGQTEAGLEALFHSRLRAVKDKGGVIVLLDNYMEPSFTRRLWCIYEVFEATQLDMPICVTLPGTCQTQLVKDLMSGQVSKISLSLLAIASQHARAWSEDDETKIKDLIRESKGGFKAVNAVVKACLAEWLGNIFQKTVLRMGITLTAQHVFPILDSACDGLLQQKDIIMAEDKYPWFSELVNNDGQGEYDTWHAMLQAMQGDAAQGKAITIWDFDHFILSRHRENVDRVFFKMLKRNASQSDTKDETLTGMHAQVLAKCQENVATLQEHLRHSQELVNLLNMTDVFGL
eukprot:TRINITY_DN7559_c0_g1_i1.p1 TRINITY_DN7559_c0_g1~~TRINITY_DN7559_c0_g1_i1.p1  ORF type:complete len:983 (+),score=160.81 TRINITY_DN7559_c0_g1_i1:103-3051(+)